MDFWTFPASLAKPSVIIFFNNFFENEGKFIYFMGEIWSYDDVLRHNSKFEAQNITTTGFKTQKNCSKTGLSYNL